jgi:uncharacterized Zn finger protein
MEVHRQQCQSCQSHDMRNILVRERGEPQTVYVRCQRCGKLVARYKLRAYYHHGKGIESYLRSNEGGDMESGRHVLEEFDHIQEIALEGYEAALEKLQEEEKEI